MTYQEKQARCSPGEFPDCGCHYTTADDGVHFCPMHKAAPDLLAACKLSLASHTCDDPESQSHPESPYHFLWAAITKAEDGSEEHV
jgi:hypothetical protein